MTNRLTDAELNLAHRRASSRACGPDDMDERHVHTLIAEVREHRARPVRGRRAVSLTIDAWLALTTDQKAEIADRYGWALPNALDDLARTEAASGVDLGPRWHHGRSTKHALDTDQ